MKFTFTNLLYALMIVAALGYILFKTYLYFKISDGDKAPDFEGTRANGTVFSLSETEGNYVILDFWASWCGPCIRDNPKLVALYEKYKTVSFADGAKLDIVTIALERNENRWKQAAEKAGFSWKNQLVEISNAVILSPIAQKYGVTEIPTKFLIDPDGTLHSVHSFEEMDDYLMSKLK